jgi:hypothetical protein
LRANGHDQRHAQHHAGGEGGEGEDHGGLLETCCCEELAASVRRLPMDLNAIKLNSDHSIIN